MEPFPADPLFTELILGADGTRRTYIVLLHAMTTDPHRKSGEGMLDV